jgi:hypothetical protein
MAHSGQWPSWVPRLDFVAGRTSGAGGECHIEGQSFCREVVVGGVAFQSECNRRQAFHLGVVT